MRKQHYSVVILMWCFFHGIKFEFSQTLQMRFEKLKNVIVDGSHVVAEEISRSELACALSCQRAATLNSCNMAMYQRDKQTCQHTTASKVDLIYDNTKSDSLVIFPRLGKSMFKQSSKYLVCSSFNINNLNYSSEIRVKCLSLVNIFSSLQRHLLKAIIPVYLADYGHVFKAQIWLIFQLLACIYAQATGQSLLNRCTS